MKLKVLFQGDSITDACRDWNDIHNLGQGYPKYAAEIIKNHHPKTEFEFFDLGISGNRVRDLLARLQRDCIDLQPDIVSIMIGVNDTWHCAWTQEWMDDAEFESIYRQILTEIKEKTSAKILMLETFLLPVEDKAFFRPDVDKKMQIIRKLAREFADEYVPTDGLLAMHSVKEGFMAWSDDGVHPNEAGSRLIGQFYAEAFDRLYSRLDIRYSDDK